MLYCRGPCFSIIYYIHDNDTNICSNIIHGCVVVVVVVCGIRTICIPIFGICLGRIKGFNGGFQIVLVIFQQGDTNFFLRIGDRFHFGQDGLFEFLRIIGIVVAAIIRTGSSLSLLGHDSFF